MGLFSFGKKKEAKQVRPSHFSTIGFSIPNAAANEELAIEIGKKGKAFALPDNLPGHFRHFTLPEGIEIWEVTNMKGFIMCFIPYFHSKNKNTIEILKSIPHSTCEYEGRFYASARETGTQAEAFPFVFDSPDYVRHNKETFPKFVDITLSAFAHSAKLFKNKEVYEKGKEKPFLGVQSFIPSGLFLPGGQEINPPRAEAIFNGIVEDGKLLKNSLTNKEFYWASVKTYSLTLDVLIDTRLITSVPVKGNIVSASAWLIGDWITH